MPPSENLGVVILGAGVSARMGRPKLLLPWGDTTVVGQIIRQWRELGAAQITVVHRPNDLPLAAELDCLRFPAQDRIENPHFEQGMFSSVLCAANWRGWREEISNWTIVLGDQPHLKMETLRTLLGQFAQNPYAICQPVYDGHGRHPVVLPRKAFDELKGSPAGSLKEFLKRTACSLVKHPMKDSGLALDLDRPEDYEKAIKSHSGSL